MITKEALRILENNLAFTKRVNRQYDDKFADRGREDRLRRQRAQAGPLRRDDRPGAEHPGRDRNAGPRGPDDSGSRRLPVLVGRPRAVGRRLQGSLPPAGGLRAGQQDRLQSGCSSTTRSTTRSARPAPSPSICSPTCSPAWRSTTTPRRWTTSATWSSRRRCRRTSSNALKGLFQQASAIAQQYVKGTMGTAAGFSGRWTRTARRTPSVRSAARRSSTVRADRGVARDARLDRGRGERLKQGDVFTIAGVFGVNPQSRQSTGDLQQFVVTTPGISDGAGARRSRSALDHHERRVPDRHRFARERRGADRPRRGEHADAAGPGVPPRRVHARDRGPAGAEGRRHGLADLGQAAGHLAPHGPGVRHQHRPVAVPYRRGLYGRVG
jgi:hypothetical protein